MDIPYMKFLQRVRGEADKQGPVIELERAGYDEVNPGDGRKVLWWKITNTNTKAAIYVPECQDMMPAADAVQKFNAIGIEPHPDLSLPAPSYAMNMFLQYAKDHGVQSRFGAETGEYILERASDVPKAASFRAPGHPGDPGFQENFNADVFIACTKLGIPVPSELSKDDGPYNFALLMDNVKRYRSEIRSEVDEKRQIVRLLNSADDSIEPVEVMILPERGTARPWIRAGGVIRACNEMRMPAPTDTPSTLAVPMYFEERPSPERLVTDGIAAAQRQVRSAGRETQIGDSSAGPVERLAVFVDRNSAARPDGASVTQEKFRDDKGKEEANDPHGEDPNHNDTGKNGGKNIHTGDGHGN